MAVPKTQPVIGDTGSDELRLLRVCVNRLLVAITDPSNTTVGLIQAAVLADPKISQIVTTRELTRAREFPTHA